MKARPADWTAVVRSHARHTKAFLVTGSEPSCVRMADDEAAHIARWMARVRLDTLPQKMPRSWFMAVIVCRGDDLGTLAAWMARHGADRVRLYLHKDATPAQLAPVRDAGHDLRHVRPERYGTYGAMHKRLGLDLSDQIYEDFRPA
jgi:hypothetical protein